MDGRDLQARRFFFAIEGGIFCWQRLFFKGLHIKIPFIRNSLIKSHAILLESNLLWKSNVIILFPFQAILVYWVILSSQDPVVIRFAIGKFAARLSCELMKIRLSCELMFCRSSWSRCQWQSSMQSLGVSKNRGVSPKMDGLQWKTLLKCMIWGYHYFRKHPFHCQNLVFCSRLNRNLCWKLSCCPWRCSFLLNLKWYGKECP